MFLNSLSNIKLLINIEEKKIKLSPIVSINQYFPLKLVVVHNKTDEFETNSVTTEEGNFSLKLFCLNVLNLFEPSDYS